MPERVCLIGLDCVPPELVFDRWTADLPSLRSLMDAGLYGPLESTIPPITVPAWMCMMTGRDPGELGIYGFRNRMDRTYDRLRHATSAQVRQPAVWDLLGDAGRRSILLGIPLTYPPRPISGLIVSDFLAPDTDSDYTWPPELKAEIRKAVGDYTLDVRRFRERDRGELLREIHAMTDQRFRLARWLLRTKPWDLFAMVEMGPDRMHHAFWRHMDPSHRLHEPGSPYSGAIHDYYVALDRHLGALLDDLPLDTLVLVVSDHGAKRMDGAFCLNEWLLREGFLALTERHATPAALDPDRVDWDRTTAWGDGGYYGRVFLNVRGREPRGTVDPQDYARVRDDLARRLEAVVDESGRPLGTRVFRPEHCYRAVNGIAPDLIAYFGDLHWRSVGSVGHGTLWLRENDTGPDDANHAQHGILILAQKTAGGWRGAGGVRRDDLSLYDVAPTILEALGLRPPEGLAQTPLARDHRSPYTEEEEAEIARRLEELGYL